MVDCFGCPLVTSDKPISVYSVKFKPKNSRYGCFLKNILKVKIFKVILI